MNIPWYFQTWNTLRRIEIDWECGKMTDRQMKIFNAIKNAYICARATNKMGRQEINALYKEQMQRADENELRRIEDIALLFFAAMFKFGGE